MTTPDTCLIVGGGIGGMAMALLLHRAGMQAEIFEAQGATDDEAGAFMNVASNGLEVLKTLGLHHQVTAEGFPAPRMVMWNGDGRRLGEVRNGAQPGQAEVSVIIRRGTLQRILREAVIRQGIPLSYAKRLEAIQEGGTAGVTATFADGSSATGALLIGCDGIHSRTRTLINPSAPKPLFTGLVSGGGFAHTTTMAPTIDTQHFIFGKRAFFGYLVKPGGEILWFENHAVAGEPRRAELSAIPQAALHQQLLDLFRDDQPFIQAIIRDTQGPIGLYPIYDLPSVPHWHRGRVVLLGDAAHATSPSVGQGASLALEDALVLAKCLRDLPDHEQAFATYEHMRRARAEKVVRISREQGSRKAASNPVARWFRDLMLPFFLKHMANATSLDWLYTYRIPWETPILKDAQA